VFISVVVPMYNAERTLEACLDAPAAQDHPARDHEILLVDNGSTDRSVAVAR
jgi:glycosyltransferase involved in cell wall biosynthesis